MKNTILLFIVVFPAVLWGQDFFTFKYKICQEKEPDKFIVSYRENNANTEDSILLVVIDSVYTSCNYHSFTIICPDMTYHVDLFNTDSIRIKYCPDFRIRQEILHPDQFCDIIDTSVACNISQLTIYVGRHSVCTRTIYSKYPLSKRKIGHIKEYVFNNGPEPMCVRKRNCWIGLPEI